MPMNEPERSPETGRPAWYWELRESIRQAEAHIEQQAAAMINAREDTNRRLGRIESAVERLPALTEQIKSIRDQVSSLATELREFNKQSDSERQGFTANGLMLFTFLVMAGLSLLSIVITLLKGKL